MSRAKPLHPLGGFRDATISMAAKDISSGADVESWSCEDGGALLRERFAELPGNN